MRLFLTTLIFLIFSISSNAQFWITSVTSFPFPANDCDIVSIVVDGNMSSSNCTHTSSYLISGNTITIDINITCGGIGLPVITPGEYLFPFSLLNVSIIWVISLPVV